MDNNAKDKRNGRIGAAVFTSLLLLALIFLGLSYQNPPPELGVEVNFGYDAVGSGNTSSAQQVEQVQQNPSTTTDNPVSDVNTDVITQTQTDAPAVNQQQQNTEVETQQEERQPDSRLTDALSATRNGQGQGEGVDESGGGDQGDPNGNPNSNSREGNSASGSGGDYRLSGRTALSKPKPVYDCQDEGTVVVKISVNRNGEVISAEAGDAIPNGPATTTTSSCLYRRAEAAARQTRWNASSTARETQIGYIIYNFQKN